MSNWGDLNTSGIFNGGGGWGTINFFSMIELVQLFFIVFLFYFFYCGKINIKFTTSIIFSVYFSGIKYIHMLGHHHHHSSS